MKGVSGFVRWVLLIAMLAAARSVMAAGDVDLSYGDAGRYRMPFDSASNWHAMAAFPDGRLVSAHGGERLHVFRSEANGRADASFGTGGERVLDPPRKGVVSAIATNPGGSTYVAIHSNTEMGTSSALLGRLAPNGDIDPGFGNGGWVEIAGNGYASAKGAWISAIEPLSDGGVAFLVAYFVDFYDECLLARFMFRLGPDGRSAPGFPAAGVPMYVSSGYYDCGAAITSGELRQLAGGLLRYSDGWDLQLKDLSGKTQPWYSDLPGQGVPYGNSFPTVMERDEPGEFNYIARGTEFPSRIEVFRILPDRTGDERFAAATGGRAIIDIDEGRSPWGSGIVIRSGFIRSAGAGEPVYLTLSVAQGYWKPPNEAVVVVRLRSDGTPDATFGQRGVLWISGSSITSGVVAALQDGSALIGLGSWGRRTVLRLAGSSVPGGGLIRIDADESCCLPRSSVDEASTFRAWATRSAGAKGAVTLRWTVVPGTAAAGADYQGTGGDLHWADGETGTKALDIPVLRDDESDPSESFSLQFRVTEGEAVLPTEGWTVSIRDVSAAPVGNPQAGGSAGVSSPISSGGSSAPGAGTTGGGGSLDYAGLAALLLLSGLRARSGNWPSRRSR
jgi:hypothetical protein